MTLRCVAPGRDGLVTHQSLTLCLSVTPEFLFVACCSKYDSPLCDSRPRRPGYAPISYPLFIGDARVFICGVLFQVLLSVVWLQAETAWLRTSLLPSVY